jgi:hypothetical protein
LNAYKWRTPGNDPVLSLLDADQVAPWIAHGGVADTSELVGGPDSTSTPGAAAILSNVA